MVMMMMMKKKMVCGWAPAPYPNGEEEVSSPLQLVRTTPAAAGLDDYRCAAPGDGERGVELHLFSLCHYTGFQSR